MFLLLLSRSWRWRPGFDPSAPVCVCSREEQKNGPNPFSVIPVRFFSSSDFMILF